MKTADPTSLLIVLPTWVGDFVMATPTLRAIRDRFAQAHITFLAEPNLRELIRGGDWMDDCVEWPDRSRRTPLHRPFRQLVRELRGRDFDWALLLQNSFRSALLARLAGIKRRIGYDRDGRGLLLTDRIPVKNLRDPAQLTNAKGTDVGSGIPAPFGKYLPMRLTDYLADLAEHVGCPRPGDRLHLFTTPDCDEAVEARLCGHGAARSRPLVVVSPGAKYGAAKCWFPDRFAGVADRLIESTGATVVITCGPGEESIAHAIRTSMRREALVFDDPLPGLGELKSLIRRCDLLLCNDAGPRHFAKAFDVPVVTIFGPTHPDWTATDYPKERIVRIDVDCGPCQKRTCPNGHLNCMTGVTVGAVAEAAEELLAVDAPGVVEGAPGRTAARAEARGSGMPCDPRRSAQPGGATDIDNDAAQ